MGPLNYAKHKNKFPGDVRNHNFPNNGEERRGDREVTSISRKAQLWPGLGEPWCPADNKMEFN